MKRVLSIFLAVAATFGAAGCGEDNKVGDDALLNFEEQAGERLGEATTTTAAPPEATTTTAAATVTTKPGAASPGATATTSTTKPAAATATTVTTAAQPAAPAFDLEITIHGDDAAEPFNPQLARVFVGSVVRWTNRDSQPRQVVFEGGKIAPSPIIPPGGSYDYKATIISPEGEPFRYGDGVRPYVVAQLEVLAK